MAGHIELDSFVRKFKNLWQSGRNAKLFVETQDGKAVINLQVGLGEAQLHPEHAGDHRDCGTAKQRRMERRAAARKEVDAAEKAAADNEAAKAEEASADKVRDSEMKKAEETSEEDSNEAVKLISSPIPQIDGATSDSEGGDLKYLLKIEAQDNCTEDDIVEAIEANFFGTLDDVKVEKDDPIRHLVVKKTNEKQVYRISIKNNGTVSNIIEGWRINHNFDNLAFGNYDFEKIGVRIREVLRRK